MHNYVAANMYVHLAVPDEKVLFNSVKSLGVCKLKILSMSFFLLFRLLVGAPEADAGQRGVVRGGAVYKCRPDSPGQCDLIQFDKEGQ